MYSGSRLRSCLCQASPPLEYNGFAAGQDDTPADLTKPVFKMGGRYASCSCPVGPDGCGCGSGDLVSTFPGEGGRTPRGHVPLRRDAAAGILDLPADFQAAGEDRASPAGQGHRARRWPTAVRPLRHRLVHALQFDPRPVPPQGGRRGRDRSGAGRGAHGPPAHRADWPTTTPTDCSCRPRTRRPAPT